MSCPAHTLFAKHHIIIFYVSWVKLLKAKAEGPQVNKLFALLMINCQYIYIGLSAFAVFRSFCESRKASGKQIISTVND